MNFGRHAYSILIAAGSVLLISGSRAGAQTYGPVYTPVPAPDYQPYPAPPVVSSVPVAVPHYADAQLDDMLAPIALYPDPLISEILPAATYPFEVASAAQFTRANPTLPQYAIDAQSWDPSVKALVHYPTVIQMMADRLDWTQAIGTAFIYQQIDVMNSIQRLRANAQAAGALYNTPEQQVVVIDDELRIIPASPEVVYVPVYDPTIVYIRHREPIRDAIHFSIGFSIGSWLTHDVDWRNHYVVRGAHWNAPGPHERPIAGPRWERDPHRPIVVAPRPVVPENHRGWEPQQSQPPHAFDPRDRREDTDRDARRGHESLQHQPQPTLRQQPAPRQEPAPRQAPQQHQEPPHQQPSPHQEPQQHQEPPQQQQHHR